jgi:uncharacterized protein
MNDATPHDTTPNHAAIVTAFFDRLGGGDGPGDSDGWLALLAEDIVADTPFAPDGTPQRFEGIDEVTRRFVDARRRMRALSFFGLEVYATDQPGIVFAVCRSEGVRHDGAPYTNRYCWRFALVDDRIVTWTEWFDPQEVLRVRE